ncbi:hypothetical protein [Methanogenium cariaci]|uniref:hypothetical protein n=1 Tax=Methanogenium cariaci TaxID=2197 RepID=UPI000783CA00|nr:hypothetical protein [Methanogenium cariaci]
MKANPVNPTSVVTTNQRRKARISAVQTSTGGFTEAMKGYYARVVPPLHTGCLTDYVLWFLGTFALLFIFIGGVC